MRESAAYQMILEEGRMEGEARGRLAEARHNLLRFGTQRFGLPDAGTDERIARLDDLGELDRLLDNVLRASSWTELMDLASGR